MRSILLTVAAAATAAALAGPSLASDQLAASAGLTPVQASGLSLTEVAQEKFNRDTENRQASVEGRQATDAARARLAANAGISADAADGLSLAEIAAVKFSRESSDSAQDPARAGSVTKAARSVAPGADRSQLIASAGLDADDARALSLSEIAQAKFDRDTDN